MRRSSPDSQYIKGGLFSLFLVLYQIMTSAYTFLPLFIGVFFTYVIINYENEKKKNIIYLIFIYFSVYDLNKGFYLFSLLLTFFLFYNLFVEKIRNFLICSNCILVLYVVVAYLGHYCLNLLISYILNSGSPVFLVNYFYYIMIDSLIVIVLFKGKV